MGKPNLSARFRLIRAGLLNFTNAKPTTLVKREGVWRIELNLHSVP